MALELINNLDATSLVRTKINAAISELAANTQTGEVVASAVVLPTPAFLPADGSVYDIATYPELETYYATPYGIVGESLSYSVRTDDTNHPSPNFVEADPTGTYLVFVDPNAASPNWIEVYKRSGTTITKLHSTLSGFTTAAVVAAWSPSGTYLAVGQFNNTSARIILYKRTGDNFDEVDRLNNAAAGSYPTALCWPRGREDLFFYVNGTTTATTLRAVTIATETMTVGANIVIGVSMQNNYRLEASDNGGVIGIGFGSGTERQRAYSYNDVSFTKMDQFTGGFEGSSSFAAAVSPNGEFIAMTTASTTVDAFANKIILFQNQEGVFTYIPQSSLLMSGYTSYGLTWSRDGAYLYVGCQDNDASFNRVGLVVLRRTGSVLEFTSAITGRPANGNFAYDDVYVTENYIFATISGLKVFDMYTVTPATGESLVLPNILFNDDRVNYYVRTGEPLP